VERDLARTINAQEALEVLNKAEEAGLVHCVNNSQDKFGVVCNCCSCCCTLLRGITELANPNAVATSSYIVNFSADECTGCFLCSDNRCPVNAISEQDDIVAVDELRCIGCGLCVSVCPFEALSMKKRETALSTPATYQDIGIKVLTEKGKLAEFIALNKE
jgi:ferredoxin